MDEAVSGGWAEVSQRAGESCPKDIQAEERLYLGRRWPLSGSVDPPSSSVWFQFMSAPCSWWDRSSPARPSLFSVLRCVFIFHSPTAESGSPHLGSPLLNPSSWTSLSGPDQEYGSAKGGPIGWDADQNKAKKKARWRPSLWPPASTWSSVGQLLYSFHLLGRRREFWSH